MDEEFERIKEKWGGNPKQPKTKKHLLVGVIISISFAVFVGKKFINSENETKLTTTTFKLTTTTTSSTTITIPTTTQIQTTTSITATTTSKLTTTVTETTTTTLESTTQINCGTDFNYFIDSSQDCSLSKLTNTISLDIFGVIQTTTTYFEIQGFDSERCALYIRTEQIDLEFPPETPQETIDEQNELYDHLEGHDGICRFNNPSDLTNLLIKWSEGNLEGGVSCTLVGGEWDCTTTGDWSNAECEGEYFSQLL